MTRSAVATDDFGAYSVGAIDGQGNWTMPQGTVKVFADIGSSVGAQFGGDSVARYTATFSNDQYASAKIVRTENVGSVNYRNGVAVRISADASPNADYYAFYHELTANSGVAVDTVLIRVVNDTPTELHRSSVAWSNTDLIELEVEGSATVLLRGMQNGTLVTGFDISDSNAARLLTGNPGIYTSGDWGRLDDWEGGNLTAGTTPITVNNLPIDSLAGGELIP